MSKQENFRRPEKPPEKTRKIDNENPFPADHFKVNNKNHNPKRLILFSGYYLGKQIRHLSYLVT